jgi:5-(aminomethyl)-3-furanmethanol phosphate kinase
MSVRPRVLKLGGSLLDWPELPAAFDRWWKQQRPAVDVLVAGGGPIVEALRQLDRVGSVPAETSHWLAIRAMGLTAALAAELLEQAVPVRGLDALRLDRADGLQVFEVERFLRDDAPSADALPCGWQVTSDSIAAHLARRIGAAELVLLKSAVPANTTSLESLVRSGYVDAYFPRAAAGLAVRCVNLRGEALD